MSEYNRLKSMLLDMQPKLLRTGGGRSQQRDMEEKRALVDTMFKYLDVDQDGWLVGDELEKVGHPNMIPAVRTRASVPELQSHFLGFS